MRRRASKLNCELISNIDMANKTAGKPEPRVGLVQMQCSDLPAENLKTATAGVLEAVDLQANVICLPELFLSPYFCQTEDHRHFDLAESIPGPTTEHFAAIAKRTQSVIICSLFEKRAPGLYHNTAAVIDADGTYLGKYRKMHIPDDPNYYEKFYFTPGDLGFKVFETKYCRVGVLICWDQWYPEAARLTALRGADVLFYPTAIGWHPSEKEEFGTKQHASWELIQRSHAVANGCYVASVNRMGHEGDLPGGIEFWGQSFIADPNGHLIAKASATDRAVLVAELDRKHIDVVRTHWPFLRDRRIDAYADITRRFLDGES